MLVQVSKRVGCYKPAARNLRSSCLQRQSTKKPVLLFRYSQTAQTRLSVPHFPNCTDARIVCVTLHLARLKQGAFRRRNQGAIPMRIRPINWILVPAIGGLSAFSLETKSPDEAQHNMPCKKIQTGRDCVVSGDWF
jgi:hypothetical protein